jgi:hypothetical protein
LKSEAGVKIGASNDDEAVKHVAILPPLLFFKVLAVPEPVLVLNGFDCMPEFCLVSAHEVNCCLYVVELGVGVGVRSSGNRPDLENNFTKMKQPGLTTSSVRGI